MSGETPEMFRPRKRPFYSRRGDLDWPVETGLIQRRTDHRGNARAEIVIYLPSLPVHEQGQRRTAGETGLYKLRLLGESPLDDLRQPL